MNTAVLIVAALLTVAFVLAGGMKVAKPKPALVDSGMGWANDFSDIAVKGIGAVEVLCAVGLWVPGLSGYAAAGLVLTMIGAAITHARRGEMPNIGVNVVLGALAAFVAWQKLG
jgi:uncharacterized membrane protein YphA (DoxX/SURF4 family)